MRNKQAPKYFVWSERPSDSEALNADTELKIHLKNSAAFCPSFLLIFIVAFCHRFTEGQSVARIADRTSSQHLWGPHVVR